MLGSMYIYIYMEIDIFFLDISRCFPGYPGYSYKIVMDTHGTV